MNLRKILISVRWCADILPGDRKQELIQVPYCYAAFGLYIASDILLPELLPAVGPSVEPDVSVVLGKVAIDGAIGRSDIYQVVERNKFLFRVPGVGSYYVTDGNCIVVDPEEQSEDRFVRIFLLGTALGVLLLQRGVVPIHGSAVVFDGYCVIFTGISGVGKSTLSATFRKRGYSILTDDVAAVVVDKNGVAWVQSAYPQQKLWLDSANVVGLNTFSALSSTEDDKLCIPAHEGFSQSPVPLAAVYELTVGGSPVSSIMRLSRADGLTALLNNTYRCWLIDGLGLKTYHFKQCLDIGRRITVSRLTRPAGIFALEDQIHLVLRDLESLFSNKFSG